MKTFMTCFLGVLLVEVICLIAIMTSGCATTTQSPEILAGKSLLSTKEVIVTSAVVIDDLCDKQIAPADKCATAKQVYEQAKPAYDLAVESLSTAILMGSADGWEKFSIANQQLLKLVTESLRLATELGVVQGGAK